MSARALVITLVLVLAPGVASAQRLLVVNCDDGELRSWLGWSQVDTVTAQAFLAMPLAQLDTYDVIESSHCEDAALASPAGRARVGAAVRRGVNLYVTTYNGDTSWLPGSVAPSGLDACVDDVDVTGTAHPIVLNSNPQVTSADLSNVGCSLHGSFTGVSPEYEVIAVSGTTGAPVMLAGQFSCGRVFVRSHHFHSTTEPRAVRFTDSVARWLTGGPPLSGTDGDGDGIDNACDNCPGTPNAAQYDCDHDNTGDACDSGPDGDGDGVEDACDTCPLAPNADQSADLDGDGTADACDNCPGVFNRTQADCDGNLIGDACDTDLDNDRVPDGCDNCPVDPNPLQFDGDGDGDGDNCDSTTLIFDATYFDDVSIFRSDPDRNQNFPSVQVHGTGRGPDKAGLIRFDTSGIPEGSEIVRAELDLVQTVKRPITVSFHFVLAPWEETAVTWRSFDNAYDPVPYATHDVLLAEQEQHVLVDVTSMVGAWFTGARPNHGMFLRTNGEGVVRFGASERPAVSQRPEMSVAVRTREPALTLLVADTGGPGLLYSVNGATGAVTELGRIGHAITALATSPEGDVFGTAIAASGWGELVAVDRRTGEGTAIAQLMDGTRSFTSMLDCTFRGRILYCWTEGDDRAATVDAATGEVNLLGGGVWAYGAGFAADAAGVLWAAPHGPQGELYTVSHSAGTVQLVRRLRGTRENITAMTWSEGTLFAIEQDGTSSFLVAIDPAGGGFTTIGELPPHAGAITTLGYHP